MDKRDFSGTRESGEYDMREVKIPTKFPPKSETAQTGCLVARHRHE
jgi:hypothetical protein